MKTAMGYINYPDELISVAHIHKYGKVLTSTFTPILESFPLPSTDN